ncbi:IS3 family transposase [Bacillus sp. AC79A.1]|uniref:IS3 family transposase n=1 Tax=Bacillus wiedmannii TaxID=1890302 RepID=UPI0011455C88|nr:IS3 family transposase [Bacillus wiedmannii]
MSKVNRFCILHKLRKIYPFRWLIEIAQVSRSGYYKWCRTHQKRKIRKQQEHILKEHIMAIHRSYPFYGYLRIQVALRKEGVCVNHKRVYRLMRELGIKSVIRIKQRYFGTKPSVLYPNHVNRKFKTDRPNRIFVTDITYLSCQNRFYYLSVIQDLYNNEIVSWKLSHRHDVSLVINTIDELARKRPIQDAILHSDQGFQYTSKNYSQCIKAYNMIGSHSRKGNCLDNACIESFFSHLKTETSYFSGYHSKEQLIQAIEKYIWFYNNK